MWWRRPETCLINTSDTCHGDGVQSGSCRSFGSELKQFSERSDLPSRSPGRQITGLGPKALLLLPAAGSEDTWPAAAVSMRDGT